MQREIEFSVSVADIQVDEATTIEIQAPATEQATIHNLWSDWMINQVDADATADPNPPTTPKDGILELVWDSPQAIDASVTITPNEDTEPNPKYTGGAYQIDIQINYGEEEASDTLNIG